MAQHRSMTPEDAAQFAEEVASITYDARQRLEATRRNLAARRAQHDSKSEEIRRNIEYWEAQLAETERQLERDDELLTESSQQIRRGMHLAIEAAHSKYCKESSDE